MNKIIELKWKCKMQLQGYTKQLIKMNFEIDNKKKKWLSINLKINNKW